MGATLKPIGENFILQTDAGAAISLSSDDVLALANSAPTFRQSIMSRRHGGAIFATPVARLQATWDALSENILLQFEFSPNGIAVYELSQAKSAELSERVHLLLSDRPDVPGRGH